MPILVQVPTYLASFAGGRNSLEVKGPAVNVKDAFQNLWEQYPALRDRIVDEQGEVRQHVNVFVGNECIRFAQGLETPVPEGAEILIVPAVSGG